MLSKMDGGGAKDNISFTSSSCPDNQVIETITIDIPRTTD
ncbi:hypothetical protein BGS_0250 [Beggiatoa sp. SS]|nr:hypothetical protein BGS_0250 [Beggiatoa sp. SS]